MVDLDYICKLLAEDGGVLADTVCEELLDDEHEETICDYGCEYSYPQTNCWKRYFEMRWRKENETM